MRAAGEDGTRLSEPELVDTLLLTIVADHETTVNLLVNAVRALLSHPDQLTLVRSGQRPWSAAVEETLRWTCRSPTGRANLTSRLTVP